MVGLSLSLSLEVSLYYRVHTALAMASKRAEESAIGLAAADDLADSMRMLISRVLKNQVEYMDTKL